MEPNLELKQIECVSKGPKAFKYECHNFNLSARVCISNSHKVWVSTLKCIWAVVEPWKWVVKWWILSIEYWNGTSILWQFEGEWWTKPLKCQNCKTRDICIDSHQNLNAQPCMANTTYKFSASFLDMKTSLKHWTYQKWDYNYSSRSRKWYPFQDARCMSEIENNFKTWAKPWFGSFLKDFMDNSIYVWGKHPKWLGSNVTLALWRNMN